jgi:ATP-dependent Clp endopeptidase proteolytic subunit ClpP
MARSSVKDSLQDFMDYGVHLPTRTIYIGSESDNEGDETGTDYKMAEKAIKGLHLLEWSGPDGEKPITAILNNLGGDVYHGMSIYNRIKSCKNHVTIIAAGYATSMGAVILQAGDDRLAYEDAIIMIHPGNWGFEGHPKTVERWLKFQKKADSRIDNIFLARIQEKKPDFSMEKFKSKTDHDMIITPDEALELNLLDGIIGANYEIRRS